MKKSFAQNFGGEPVVLMCVCLFLIATALFATGAQQQEARVSQIIQDVRLLEAHGAPRPAAVNDAVTQQMGVRTGVESRAELTFTDLTLTRLGANTIFSFSRGARELDLTSGTVLLEVPPDKPAVKINTSAVTAAVTGGTALLSTGPPMKFMVLEGVGTFYPIGHPEKAVTVRGGEMMLMTADGHVTRPEKFNVKLVMETSPLIKDFPPLANLPLIVAVMNQQVVTQQLASSQSLVNDLADVIDAVDQNRNANPVLFVRNPPERPTPRPRPNTPTPPPNTPTPPPTPTPGPPTPTPSGTPGKFGTPGTITSPNPYVITGDTVINTDPSITANGVTDYGKIYRGQAQDGLLSAFVFGSTSTFDITSGFDLLLGGNRTGAVFKFTALELAGDPTIITAGGETNLALIAVNGITSSGPGDVLTFSGLEGLLLATQNGSIHLGPEISFSGLDDLNIYARGLSSDLTLASDISTTSNVRLFAEHDLLITSNITTDDLYAFVGRNLTIGGSTTIQAATISLFAGARLIGTIGGDHQTNNLTLSVLNNGGEIDAGANLSLEVLGSLTAQNHATFEIQNNGGTIGQNAPIRVAAANLSTNSLTAQIDNRNGGVIGGNAVVAMSVASNANVTNDATLAIYGSDGAANSAVLVNGGNYNVGGTFLSYIDGNGTMTFNRANAHADVLKAGVLGTNGVLNIGGGTLSADTILKLYAPGSNGQLNFVSNVTLGGNSVKILAANSVTIFDDVVVTIGGSIPADVYTNNANYSERWGGNGSTTGTFAGAGANRPRPLSDAPPFDAASPGNPTHRKRSREVINVQDSGQLLAMLDGDVTGRGGRLGISRNRQRNAAKADRMNVNRMMKANRDMADIRRMHDRGVLNPRLGAGAKPF
jgi:FecR protein